MRNPTLFEMEKLGDAAKTASELKVERPYGILLGTSSSSAKGWEGTFYPSGMKSRDFLSYYATLFATVEVDSTFYGCPAPTTVKNWAARTPEDFIFSVKVPQVITYEKALVDCDSVNAACNCTHAHSSSTSPTFPSLWRSLSANSSISRRKS